VVNLVGVGLKERPAFLEALLPRAHELRAKTGRPHWIVIDEAHHVLPTNLESTGLTVTQHTYGVLLITLEADRVSPTILSAMDLVITIGEKPGDMLRNFSRAVQHDAPADARTTLRKGEALAWFWRSSEPPFWIRTEQPRVERRRHRRKYAEGELPPEQSFYFRGPEDKLNLRAQNLEMFLQLAEGVDDETWMFHLRRGHFSQWFQNVIKDPELAAASAQLEKSEDIDAEASRKIIRSELEKRYILAA
jgi:hypothetical protein